MEANSAGIERLISLAGVGARKSTTDQDPWGRKRRVQERGEGTGGRSEVVGGRSSGSRRLTASAQTTMPRSLPPEILDLTFDYLRDELATLKACCIVSKSWIPRIRRHLFAHVKFDTFRFAFESWMKAFPDPSSSPAHYVRTLTIIGINIVAAASTDVGRWIRAFHNVVHLNFDDVDARGLDGNWGNDGRVSFLPFHGVSPVIRSLRLDTISIQPSEIFGLVCSFPLLEDFALGTIHCERRVSKWIAPLTSPRLTGSLKLSSMVGGIDRTARRLFDFPNGLHFTEIVLECVDEADFKFATDLVSRCSDTLESLNVTDKLLRAYTPPLTPD